LYLEALYYIGDHMTEAGLDLGNCDDMFKMQMMMTQLTMAVQARKITYPQIKEYLQVAHLFN